MSLDESKIKAVLDAATKPCPEISPSFSMPGKFSYKNRDGVGFGTASSSAEELAENWRLKQMRERAEFDTIIRVSGPKHLERQFEYWVTSKQGRIKA